MSFEPNDMNTIHLGNYEEFFILYMDNELSGEQMKMVDEFLLANPDLKAEFEILMSTKLPLEEFSFDKNELLSERMQLSAIDEELLLYIDNELPSAKKNIVASEIASNKSYQLQYEGLLQTKLDASETISYPDKKELFRKTKRVIAFKTWRRVAAAVIIIATGGMFYFRNSSYTNVPVLPQNTLATKKSVHQNLKKDEPANNETTSFEKTNRDQILIIHSSKKENGENGSIKNGTESLMAENAVATNTPTVQDNQTPEKAKVTHVQFETDNTIAFNPPEVSVNKNNVTSPALERNINGTTVDQNESIAGNHKGSVKGFLRKATRMIEKRTGFDPANENGELLIGAVAISLK